MTTQDVRSQRLAMHRGTLQVAAIAVALGACLAAAHPTYAVAPASRRTLASGATLIVTEQHALPMVVIQMIIDAGARRDPRGKEGVAALTADLLTEGTTTRSASKIKEDTDFIGASLDTGADADFATVSLTVLSKDLGTGLDLLADVLLHPTFPEAEVTRRREATLANMQAQQDEPGQVAGHKFTETLYRGEPYGHTVDGFPDSVRKLTRHDMIAFYAKHYHADNAIISVAGDVTMADIAARLEAALRSWPATGDEPFEYPATKPAPPETVTIDKPITQANIILGQRGIARDNPDYYAVTVMNFILGGGAFTSRLMDNVRVKGGLAYSVGSAFTVNKSPGSFQVVMQTKNESATDAIQRVCAELERVRSEAVSDDELDSAKLYLTGSFPLRFDTNAKIAGFRAQVQFFNLGNDYAERYAERINAITKEDVQRVAQQYLRPQQLELIVVANLSQAKIPAGAACAAPPAPQAPESGS